MQQRTRTEGGNHHFRQLFAREQSNPIQVVIDVLAGLPTIVMLDKGGKEVIRFNEEVHADKLYAAMKCASAGAPAPTAVGMK